MQLADLLISLISGFLFFSNCRLTCWRSQVFVLWASHVPVSCAGSWWDGFSGMAVCASASRRQAGAAGCPLPPGRATGQRPPGLLSPALSSQVRPVLVSCQPVVQSVPGSVPRGWFCFPSVFPKPPSIVFKMEVVCGFQLSDGARTRCRQ